MDLLFMGITDIIIVLLIVSFLVLGAKLGIIQKIIKMASTLVALIGAFFFCGQFKDVLISHNIIYPSVYNNILGNLQTTEAFKNPNATLDSFLTELGLPNFLTKIIADTTNIQPQQIAEHISGALSGVIMSVIAFFVLFFGIIILSWVLKLVNHLLRNSSKLYKICDGILGLVAYGLFSVILVYVLLFVVSLCIQIPALESFKNFMIVDMQLNTDKFRISKYLYENNLILNFFGLLV